LGLQLIKTDLLSFLSLADHSETFSRVEDKTFWSHTTTKFNITFYRNVTNLTWLTIDNFDTLFFSWPAQGDRMIWITTWITWFWMSLDYKHFYNSIVSAWKSFIGLAFINIYEFDFTIFCANIHDRVLKCWTNKRTYHCVVLNNSL